MKKNRRFLISNTLYPKSNCSNTLSKFYSPIMEKIENLNYAKSETLNNNPSGIHKGFFQLNNIESAVNIEKNRKELKLLDYSLPQLLNTNVNKLMENKVMQKMENVAYETKMNQKKKYLEEKLNEKKKIRDSYTHKIFNLQKEIENFEVEINFNSNFTNYIDLKNRKLNQYKYTKIEKMKSRNEEQMFAYVSMMQKAVNKREEKILETIEEIEKMKMKKLSKQAKVEKVEIAINNIREELKVIKDNLINYYHKLLTQGQDTRQEGLVWIIREIFLLGADVILSKLPTFLDEKCITYLFRYTHIEMEFIKMKEHKLMYKQALKEKRDAELQNQNYFKNTFKTSLENQNSFKITEEGQNNTKFNNPQLHTINYTLTKSHVIQKYKEENKMDTDAPFNMKTIDSFFLNSKNSIDKETEILISLIKRFEDKENELKQYLSELKKQEMNRLFKEFTRNDYERRFNVTKDVVISAMIGEDNTQSELLRQAREYKIFQDKIKMCRTFNPSEALAVKATADKKILKYD